MNTIHVDCQKPYDVLVGHGLLPDAGRLIRTVSEAAAAAIITDTTVDSLYRQKVQDSLESAGFRVVSFAFSPGEDSKTLDTLGKIYGFLCEQQLTRTDLIVALGGGIPGDVAGFAASTYLRGVDYVQIPTTLLAQIDSSVGGKTAVNIPQGKNLVGAFCQPKLVLCDIDTLDTLPRDIFADGAAEALKYGVIRDRELFGLIAGDVRANLEQSIRQCIQIKSDIVSRDEFDTGERMLLNFGHTLGHAIEKHSGHRISHGRAVAIGMVWISRVTVQMGLTPPEVLTDLIGACKNLGLNTDYLGDQGELLRYVCSDKKRTGGSIRIVVCTGLGSAEVRTLAVEDFMGQCLRVLSVKDSI